MKIETFPLIVGAIVGLLGLLLLFDAWTPDETVVNRERRRASRPERSRGGETAIGFGVLCLAAAILGRDSWPYSIVSAIAGAALVLLGTILSRRYIKGRLVTYVDEPAVDATAPADRQERELRRDVAPEAEPRHAGPPSHGSTPAPEAPPASEKRLRIR